MLQTPRVAKLSWWVARIAEVVAEFELGLGACSPEVRKPRSVTFQFTRLDALNRIVER